MENKQKIVDIVERTQFHLDGDLEEHYSDEDTLNFATRENGCVGSETPGHEDVMVADNLRKELIKLDCVSEVEVEEVDEWVHINVTLK
jgi:hypothetical protein